MIAQKMEDLIRDRRTKGEEPFAHISTVRTQILQGEDFLMIGVDATRFENGTGEALVARIKADLKLVFADQPEFVAFIQSKILSYGESPNGHPVAEFIRYGIPTKTKAA